MRKSAERGENVLETELKRVLNLTSDDFTTEEDAKKLLQEGEAAPLTPDVLFKVPQMILGKMCHWAEAKHSVVVPGLSPAKIIADIKRQTDKYVEAFGPGLILWTKCGFCESLRAELSPAVLHVVPNAVAERSKNQYFVRSHRAYNSATNALRQDRAHYHYPPAPLVGLFDALHPPWMPGAPLRRTAVPSFPFRNGSAHFMHPSTDYVFARPDWSEGEKAGRTKLLDRLAEEAQTAAAARARLGAQPSSTLNSAAEEDDSVTVMLVRMFTVDENEGELLLAKLLVYVKLLRLNDSGAKALSMVGKILQKIIDEPDAAK